MNDGILAHLGGRFAIQRELLATQGLTYLLDRSDACASAIRQAAAWTGITLSERLHYRAEVAGGDLERPDIIGADEANDTAVIIEGKFDAALTENQPVAYLRRLPAMKPGILIFVVPAVRLPSLWRQVAERAGLIHSAEVGGATYARIGARHAVMMISWRELLALMLNAAAASAEGSAQDVMQLQALCARMEGAAFLPFSGGELDGIQLPRRHRDLCDLTDSIVDRLVRAGDISLAGFKATALRTGYVRYFALNGTPSRCCGAIGLMYDAWQEFEQSPLWFSATDTGHDALGPLLHEHALALNLRLGRSRGGHPLLPLPVEPNLELAEIVARCVLTVQTVARKLRSAPPGPRLEAVGA